MTRIRCKTPSTGQANNFTIRNVPSTEWVTLAEASDYSVPDASNVYGDIRRDPSPTGAGRAIRPGEVFFMTPIYVRNKSESTCWIDVQLYLEVEEGASDSAREDLQIQCPGRIVVPAGDTALIPIQGRSLLKRSITSEFGDRIQVKAEVANTLDIWGSGEIKPSAENIIGTV